ncbi:MAG: tRNA adenosine(34) deaminase TadA [Deltaproteobacteria bacterium]|nr:tRNA adenosine(34) deaminase TadA [Deltaproteobacteria bacterium]
MTDEAPDKEDAAFMAQALAEAEAARGEGEVPVGAVVVCGGQVIGRGHNRREALADPTSHAEISAIREAVGTRPSWRLDDCTLYVTLEPCVMCAGAIVQARVRRVVFGCLDPKGGAVRSLYRICDDPRLNHRVEVTEGVLAERCGEILKRFFATLRERD